MITYGQYLTTHQTPIIDISDETVEQACADWFKYRYLGFENVDKFTDIFRRNVSVLYPIYKEKLRIQPGVSQYDWLVTTYRERQLKTTGNNENTTTYNTNTATIENGSNTDTKTGNVIVTNGGTTIDTKTGSVSETKVDGKHTTEVSPHVSRVSTNGGHVSNWSGDTSVQAVNPMSKSYSDFTTNTDGDIEETGVAYSRAYNGLPKKLDWATLSQQGQTGHRDYNVDKRTVTESYKYGSDGRGDVTVTEGDAASPDSRSTTYNSVKDLHAIDTTTTTQDTTTDTSKNSKNGTVTHTGTDSVVDTNDRTDREQVTGRDGDIGELLRKATDFIERSSAWIWLREQLDCCFYPGYYTDSEENEGSALI